MVIDNSVFDVMVRKMLWLPQIMCNISTLAFFLLSPLPPTRETRGGPPGARHDIIRALGGSPQDHLLPSVTDLATMHSGLRYVAETLTGL